MEISEGNKSFNLEEKVEIAEENLSEKGKKFVSLIVKIIVNATIKECYEKGDKVSEIQR